MKRYYFLLNILFLLNSCNYNNTLNITTTNYEYSLLCSEKNKKIFIDDSTDLYSFSVHYYETQNNEYLSIENEEYDPLFGIIKCYDLDSNKLINTTKINYIGKDIISGFCGHGWLNDSIFVISSDEISNVYIVNKEGKILKDYDLNENKRDLLVKEYSSLNNKPAICIGSKLLVNLYIPYSRRINSPNGSNFDFNKCPLGVFIDTISNEICEINLKYPNLYQKNDKDSHLEDYSNVYDGKRIIYSFECLDNLFVSYDFEHFIEFNGKSKYIGNITNDGIDVKMDNEMAEKIFFTQPSYSNILYDKYRNVYYRLCFMKDESSLNSKNQLPLEYNFCHGDFSIIIFDNDLNIIGETKFNRGQYAPEFCFINKEGLWLSENNYERVDNSEDEFIFRCFILNKDEK